MPDERTEALAAPQRDHAEAVVESLVVRQAFRRLPTRWKSVLWWSYVEDVDRGQILQLTGLTSPALAQLSLRARTGLRAALG